VTKVARLEDGPKISNRPEKKGHFFGKAEKKMNEKKPEFKKKQAEPKKTIETDRSLKKKNNPGKKNENSCWARG